MIEVSCQCGRSLKVQDEHAGQRVTCKACKATLTVPVLSEDDEDDVSDRAPKHWTNPDHVTRFVLGVALRVATAVCFLGLLSSFMRTMDTQTLNLLAERGIWAVCFMIGLVGLVVSGRR